MLQTPGKPTFARSIVLALALLSALILTIGARYFYLALVQEHRPSLALAALRIEAGESVVTVDEERGLFLAMAAMERPDGDWPIRKHLEASGLIFVDQLGAVSTWQDSQGKKLQFQSRMFTRRMMVVERTPW